MIASPMGAAHLAGAVAALVLGAMVLGAPKGTEFHRAVGAGYAAAMVILNVSALAIYRLTGHFEPFHALALASLATIARGIVPAVRRRPGWLMRHYRNMAWSYVALLAATGSEIVLRVLLRAGTFAGPRADPWQIIGGGIAITVLFVGSGAIVLPRLRRTAMAHMDEQSAS
jgi:uncharacterized membrane protein